MFEKDFQAFVDKLFKFCYYEYMVTVLFCGRVITKILKLEEKK